MHCEACGARTNPGARFCAACGAPLSRAAPPGPAANAGVAPEPAREPEPRPPFAPVSTRRSEPHGYGALAPSNPNLPAAFSPGNALAPGSNWRHTHPTFCLACQQRTVPVPFFSRGFNLAKAAALLPLSPIAPLVFFLVRRDRLVCSWCKSILPGEASLSLLDSFSPAPAGLMGGGSESDALMRSADAVHNEVALHEHTSRRSKRRATTFGLASLMFAGIGGTVALEQGAEEAT
ncbi:MAG TPA: zinc ribbon domain-containing protein, partial [Polyangia bacterium]